MAAAPHVGRDQRRRLGSASTLLISATGAIGLLLAGCGTTSDVPELGAERAEPVLPQLEIGGALPDGALDEVYDGPSFVATAVDTELTQQDRTGGEVAVYEDAGDDEPSQTIANPVDGAGQAVAPVVFLVDGDYDPNADWIEVNLPVRPNGSTGWVRAEDVEITSHEFRIKVKLADHRIVVSDDGEVVLDAPAGVGTSQAPTPGGVFYTRSLIRSTNPAYGPYAYGLSGYSEVHETFGNGPGDIGIHGTADAATVGADVSAGCIRLTNDDIETLADILPLGVPVEIVA